ncbi:MAG: AAA family ATPase [Polyangiaceae bacterium]|nr:AAA family ATPase [Polyangiaceae bacterium]
MGESLSVQVLRYWLACVRMEEALGARPKARRAPSGDRPVNIDMSQPVEGVEYLRLPCDRAMWAAACGDELKVAVDSPAAAYFETWLHRQYRGGAGPRRNSSGSRDSSERLKHLLCFPVVHLRRGELAGLLRCDVELEFLQGDGTAFVVPGAKTRRAGTWPPPPSDLRVQGADPGISGRLPFFVDTRLLHDELGVEPQEIDGFFSSLSKTTTSDDPVSPGTMLRALCGLLALPKESAVPAPITSDTDNKNKLTQDDDELAQENQREDEDIEPVLSLMVTRMNQRLRLRPSGAKAYPLSLVVDAQQARSTWHLQREMQILIDEPSDDDESALHAYLSGNRPEVGSVLQKAAYPGSALTPSQREAAEQFLGSALSAVQGPPGTGKTTLILHLAAQHIVEQVDALVDDGKMGCHLMVVASTNNRAVDNVIEPLNRNTALGGGKLPLALRTGSRDVFEKITSRQLRDAVVWLARYIQPAAGQKTLAKQSLDASIGKYRELRTTLLEIEAERVLAMGEQNRLSEIRTQLVELNRQLGSLGALPPQTASNKETQQAVDSIQGAKYTAKELSLLKRGMDALDRLSDVAGRSSSDSAMRQLDRAYGKFKKEFGEPILTLHQEIGNGDTWPLPPKPKSTSTEEIMMAWEDAVQQSIGCVIVLAETVGDSIECRKLITRRQQLIEQLSTAPLEADTTSLKGASKLAAPACDSDALDALRAELFLAALAVRQAWAIVHADKLHEALKIAVRYTASEKSMRTLFRAEDEAGRWLRRLLGVWGCTLLSMANAVPAESRALSRIIIDEAGQCHPAYAVSALLRCQSALIIGDVHQLEPVVGLGKQDEERVQAQARTQLSDSVLAPYRVYSEGRNSVQSLAARALGAPLRLIDHFRCQPSIIALCDSFCNYGLHVHTAPANRATQASYLEAPLLFLDVDGQQERLGGSWINPAEISVCLGLLEDMLRCGIDPSEVAIITPYRGQLELLQRGAAQRGIPIDRGLKAADQMGLFGGSNGECGLTLGTVHRFQGGERSCVIFSSVVTEARSLGFLNDRVNLLNVTISRAREHLITIGNQATLATGRYTRRLADDGVQALNWIPHTS